MRFVTPFLIVATLFAWFTTRHGIGLTPDSFSYVAGARALSEGRGFCVPFTGFLDKRDFVPLTHFPPLYPSFLAATATLTGTDPILSARYVALSFCLLNVLLCFLVLLRLTENRIISALGVILFLFSPDIVTAHFMAWSEPLFYTCLFLMIFFMIRYTETPGALFVGLAGFAVALSVLVRYAGLALMVATLMPLFLRDLSARKRLQHILIFAFATIPAWLWMLRNMLVAGSATDRVISSDVMPAALISAGLQTLSHWFLPGILNRPVAGGLILTTLFLLGLVLPRLDRIPKATRIQLQCIFLLFATYVIFLILAFSFDPAVVLDGRMLSPAYILTILLIAGAARAWNFSRQFRMPVAILLVLFLFFFCRRGIDYVTSVTGGQGFAASRWRNSETIATVGKMAFPGPIYTNAPGLISVYTQKPTKTLPEKETIDKFADVIKQRNGTLVVMDSIDPLDPMQESEIELTASLKLIHRLSDGRIYR
jgi:hypothetical protein